MTKENKNAADKESDFYLPITYDNANCSGLGLLVVMFGLMALGFYLAITARSVGRLIISLMFGALFLGLFIWLAYLFVKGIIGKLKK